MPRGRKPKGDVDPSDITPKIRRIKLDEKDVERWLQAYLKNTGNVLASAREVGVTRVRFKRAVEVFRFDEQLNKHRERVARRASRPVAEAQTRIIDEIIDPFLEDQARVLTQQIRDNAIPFDDQAVERLAKLRELLTGGATARIGGDMSTLAQQIAKLSLEEQRELAGHVKRIALESPRSA